MGTIRFELRTDKKDKEGKAPIRIKYQVQSIRVFYPTGEKVYPHNWNQQEQQAIYVSKKELKKAGIDEEAVLNMDIEKVNNKLTELRLKIKKIEDRFMMDGIAYTASLVVDRLKEGDKPVTKKDTSSKELFAFIDKYIKDNEHLREKSSLSIYKSLKSYLLRYEKDARTKITFDKINHDFFTAFQNYLVHQTIKARDGNVSKALNNISINKLLLTLKTFINYAKGLEVAVPNYKGFKIKKDNDELEVIALTREEFDTLWNLDLSKRPAWDQVRDVFIFSCVTGLRFSDLEQLRWEHIKKDGWIELTTIKTKQKLKIPPTPYSRAILAKYKAEERPLPIITNQRSNEHLAKICKHAGLNQQVEIVRHFGNKRVSIWYPKYDLIRMHCGRKSFATLSLIHMNIYEVMKIGGWKDIRTLKRYANVDDEAMQKGMERAWGDPSKKLKVAS